MSSNQPSVGNISEKQESLTLTFDDFFTLAKARCLEGHELEKAGKLKEAVVKYSKAIDLVPHPFFFCYRAGVYFKMGEYEKVVKECLTAIKLDPNYAPSYCHLGFFFSCQKRYEEAIEVYKKAVELDPENEEYKKELASAEEKFKATKQKSSSLSPEVIATANALNEQGNEYMNDAKFKEAILKYTQAISMKRDPIYLCNRCSAFCRLQQYSNASNDSKDAVLLDGNYAKFNVRSGFIYSSQGLYSLSVQAYKRALELDPTNEMYEEYLAFAEANNREAEQEQ